METLTTKTIDAAVTLDRSCLDWRVRLDPDETRQFLGQVDSYNNCNVDALFLLTETIDAAIGRKRYPDVDGRPNPNNGTWAHSYDVGNEGSRVLYLELFKGSGLPGLDYGRLAHVCAAVGQAVEADENTLETNDAHYFRWRWWWD